MAPLRVLLISDWYPDDPEAAAGSFVRQQALSVAHDHEVTVLHLRGRTPGERWPRLEEELDGPLRTLRVRHARPALPTTAVNLWAVAAALRRLRHAGRGPDLLHAHEYSAGFAAVVLGRLVRRPVIVSEHSSDFATGDIRGVAAWIARRAFAGADLVCPVSHSLRSELDRGGWGGRYEIVPNVVDTETFSGPRRTNDREMTRIVAVASLEPVKGVGDLLEAVAGLAARRTDFTVAIAGDGPLRADLERRAHALALDARLAFLGALPRDAVASLMQRADFAVIPSRWETFSVVLSEAMACGLPVVATSAGALPERVHEHNGILCPARDPRALAAALERMLDEHRGYDRDAIAGEVRATLSPAKLGARWNEIYAAVAGNARGAA